MRHVLSACVLLALNACAAPVTLPSAGNLPQPKAVAADVPTARGLGAVESKAFEAVPLASYEAGSRNEVGVAGGFLDFAE